MSPRASRARALPVLDVTAHAEAPVSQSADVIVLYPPAPVELRHAQPSDAPAIHALLENWVQDGRLLPRTLEQVYRTIREYVVAVHGNRMVACGALRIYSSELGEICALAVASEFQGRGIGQQIVETLVAEATALGLKRVFAMTTAEAFFRRAGFDVTPIQQFPQKIAQDCSSCERRRRCVEIAMVRELGPHAD